MTLANTVEAPRLDDGAKVRHVDRPGRDKGREYREFVVEWSIYMRNEPAPAHSEWAFDRASYELQLSEAKAAVKAKVAGGDGSKKPPTPVAAPAAAPEPQEVPAQELPEKKREFKTRVPETEGYQVFMRKLEAADDPAAKLDKVIAAGQKKLHDEYEKPLQYAGKRLWVALHQRPVRKGLLPREEWKKWYVEFNAWNTRVANLRGQMLRLERQLREETAATRSVLNRLYALRKEVS